MAYYVIATDGNRYGPVELDVLNQWAAEGRVIPSSQIIDSVTNKTVHAHELLGLTFPTTKKDAVSQNAYPGDVPVHPGYYRPQQGNPYQQQPQQPYQQPYQYAYPAQGSVTGAWVLGSIGAAVSLLGCCCFISAILGIGCSTIGMVLANQAKQQGNPKANAANIFNLVVLIVAILMTIAGIAMHFLIKAGSPRGQEFPF